MTPSTILSGILPRIGHYAPLPPRLAPTMPEPSDRQLVDAILDATANLSSHERSRKTGIGATTFQRWQRGDWELLQAGMRRKVIAYLQRRGAVPPSFASVLTEAERDRLAELIGQMERIQAEMAAILKRPRS